MDAGVEFEAMVLEGVHAAASDVVLLEDDHLAAAARYRQGCWRPLGLEDLLADA